MKTFPELRFPRFAYANLNQWAIELDPLYARDTRRDPDNCDNIVTWLQRHLNAEIIYGGWMEDRSYLLAGTYLATEKIFLHLGIDICVPAGTKVAVSRRVKVLRIDCDTPLRHGWGTSIACEIIGTPIVLLYGHLGPTISCRAGDILSPGDIIGAIGDRPDNGGWFPHLHVQAMYWQTFQAYSHDKESWDQLDGYGKEKDKLDLARAYPDPLPYIGLFD